MHSEVDPEIEKRGAYIQVGVGVARVVHSCLSMYSVQHCRGSGGLLSRKFVNLDSMRVFLRPS